MLTAFILALATDAPVTVPALLGRANYAAALGELRRVDPALAAAIHDSDGPKPITCSGLLGVRPQGDQVTLQPGEHYHVRITGLTEAVSASLTTALLEPPPAVWELDHHPVRVVAACCDPAQHVWSGRTTYAELAAAQLLQGPQPARSATLYFASPTAFKSGGMTVPLPLPGLVFGSLVERWNTFSPITLSPEMRRFGEEMVAISRYRLESLAVEQKNAGLRIGGVGRVTYVALGGDRYWHGVLQMLADFAFYSGVGMQTATGMGQTRRVG